MLIISVESLITIPDFDIERSFIVCSYHGLSINSLPWILEPRKGFSGLGNRTETNCHSVSKLQAQTFANRFAAM